MQPIKTLKERVTSAQFEHYMERASTAVEIAREAEVNELRAALASQGEPYGWVQFIDGVQTQNFARNEKELNTIKTMFRQMKLTGNAEYVAVYTAPPAAVPAPEQPTWTCFHCSESFHDRAAAELHFGSSEIQEPMCKVDQIKFREMEALMRRYTAEDTDLHREIYRLNTEHNAALRRAEEEGYAKGLKATAPAQAVDALGIKTWQERLLDDRVSTAIMRAKARDAEIAELRAALAAQSAAPAGESVAWLESEESARRTPIKEVMRGMFHTAVWHFSERPQTSNPVWTLHAPVANAGQQTGDAS